MNATLVLPATEPAPLTDDAVMELLNPTEPAMTRMATSFQLCMVLRHITSLIAAGEHADAAWQADMRASLAAIAEMLG